MSSACLSILEIQSQAASKDTVGDAGHQRRATNSLHHLAFHIPSSKTSPSEPSPLLKMTVCSEYPVESSCPV